MLLNVNNVNNVNNVKYHLEKSPFWGTLNNVSNVKSRKGTLCEKKNQ